jgi:hypothetical protein
MLLLLLRLLLLLTVPKASLTSSVANSQESAGKLQANSDTAVDSSAKAASPASVKLSSQFALLKIRRLHGAVHPQKPALGACTACYAM